MTFDPSIRRALYASAVCAALTTLLSASELEEEFYHHECGSLACMHGKAQLAREAGVLSDLAWDEATGADLRNFPPDRKVDFEHMKLEMVFDDLNQARFTATETLTFTPIGSPLDSLTLNAVGLKIDAVEMGGNAVEHFHDGEVLTLRFDPPPAVDKQTHISIKYACEEPIKGMFFTPESPAAPGYGPEVHTQGQTIFNRHWFICHDSPNERMSTELIVDVPAEFQVSSNGRLRSHRISNDRAKFHWVQEKPHVSYLVSLIIGRFDVVELAGHRVPMHVWVPKGLGHQVQQTYGNTGAMIDLYERLYGVAYPWDRYDQLVVRNFGSGGMENTSATTMYPTAIFDKTALLDRDLDGLISHELAHQWTGDLITCKSWEHIWLNEGWATYGTALWFEERDGIDGYLDSMRSNFRRVTRRDRTTNDLPMVSPVYKDPWETFRRAANPYPKGASIIHMLRKMLGEEVFWDGVQTYMNRHADGVVETSDFRYALEEASGLGLEWFFDQWCYRPGVPNLDISVDYDGATRDLMVKVNQTQQVDVRTPAFRFNLPVFIETSAGAQTHVISVDSTETTFNTTLDGPPSIVAIDPDLHVLKTMQVEKPMNLWVNQLNRGPTIAAQHVAADALGDEASADNLSMLLAIASDEGVRHTLRNSALDAIASHGNSAAHDTLIEMARNNVAEARVRSTLVDHIGRIEDRDDVVIPMMAAFAGEDPSYNVRVQAIQGLAARDARDHADLIADLVHFRSQHESVRNAALAALADLEDDRGLDLAIQYSAYGNTDRARARTVGMIDEFAQIDQDRAVEFLLSLLDDPESRTVNAAAGALANIGDERALQLLQSIADAHPDPQMRNRAEGWVSDLRENMEGNEDA